MTSSFRPKPQSLHHVLVHVRACSPPPPDSICPQPCFLSCYAGSAFTTKRWLNANKSTASFTYAVGARFPMTPARPRLVPVLLSARTLQTVGHWVSSVPGVLSSPRRGRTVCVCAVINDQRDRGTDACVCVAVPTLYSRYRLLQDRERALSRCCRAAHDDALAPVRWTADLRQEEI